MTEVLNVSGVGKGYPVFRNELARFARWFGLPTRPETQFWAVRDVSFSMRKGEVLALIGQNGAGKSTLLKLITGTVRPTEGSVAIDGRVSAILELGLGFNPEFTGRENVMHSGGMMGHSGGDLRRLMPEIEAFAEIGDHFDKPLRTYSSGMQARLAFSLATAIRPELLIVDEVLSVGDAYFQHKSFSRIRKFKEEGVSILIVTHSMGDVREICDRVILLDKGVVVRDGPPDEVVDYYNALIAERENANLTVEQKRAANGWVVSRSGTFEVWIDSLELVDAETGSAVSSARTGQLVELRALARLGTDIPTLVFGFMLRDRMGHVVYGTNTWHTGQALEDLHAGDEVMFKARFRCDLGPGSYSVSPALVSSSTHLENNYEWTDNLLVFDVVNFDRPHFIGSSSLDADFTIEREDGAASATLEEGNATE